MKNIDNDKSMWLHALIYRHKINCIWFRWLDLSQVCLSGSYFCNPCQWSDHVCLQLLNDVNTLTCSKRTVNYVTLSTKVMHHCLQRHEWLVQMVFIIYLNRPFTASIKANIKQMKGTGANRLYCLRKLCNAEKSVSKEDVIQHHCKPWNTFFWYSCVTHI